MPSAAFIFSKEGGAGGGVSTPTCQITALPCYSGLNKAGSLTHEGAHTVQISKPQETFHFSEIVFGKCCRVLSTKASNCSLLMPDQSPCVNILPTLHIPIAFLAELSLPSLAQPQRACNVTSIHLLKIQPSFNF